MNQNVKNRSYYPWLIMVSCCFLQGAVLGILNNCAGLFYVPVMQEFGVKMSQATLTVTIKNLVQCVGTLFAAKILLKYRLRYVVTISSLIVGASQISLAYSHSIVHWYICAVIQGIFTVFMAGILIPLVIANWFTKRTGFALGMTSMSAGLFGALMSAILGALITNVSWRFSMLVSGIAVLALSVPVGWFVLALTPEEKSCTPYGGAQEKTNSKDGKVVRIPFDHRVVFIILIAFCGSFGAAFNSHLAPFGSMIGIAIVAPATLLTINMIGNMVLKTGFGALNDRIGSKKTTIISFGLVAAAALMFSSGLQLAICFAAFIHAGASLIQTTEIQLLAKDAWRKDEYPIALQVLTIAIRLSFAVFALVIGLLFDLWGSYTNVIWLQFCVAIIGSVSVVLLFTGRKRVSDQA